MSADVVQASLEVALGFWKAIDLPAWKRQLSGEVASVADRVEHTKQQGLLLRDSYKQWKKSDGDAETKLAAVLELIKQFQGNDDSLQKRAKGAETALLAFSKDMLSAADPVPALTCALEHARANATLQHQLATANAELVSLRSQLSSVVESSSSKHLEELSRLQRENGELEDELAQLKNQDITIRSLGERLLELEASMETQVAEGLAAKESELRSAFEQELERVRESEAAAETRMAQLQAALQDAQLAKDEAQAALYTVRARAEEESNGARAEAETAQAEVERMSRQLALAQASVEEWKRKSQEAGGESMRGPDGLLMSPAVKMAQIESLRARAEGAEEEVSRVSTALSAVQEENRRWAALLEAQRSQHEKAVQDLRGSVSSKDAELSALRTELASRAAPAVVADLRRQLALLQAVQFGAGDADDEVSPAGPSADAGSSSGSSGDVHSIMLKRIRQLESRAVRAEGAAGEAKEEADKLRAELSACQEQLEEQKGLVAQMDELLSGSLRQGAVGAGHAERVGSGRESIPASMLSPGGKGSMGNTEQTLINILASPGSPSTTKITVLPETSSDSGSAAGEPSAVLTTVLRGQRDKFRARTLELEADVQAKQTRLAEANERVRTLHTDNLRLYEKVRYLSNALEGAQRVGRGDHAEQGHGSSTKVHVASAPRLRQGPAGSQLVEEEPFESEYARAYREGIVESIQMGAGAGAGGLSTAMADPLAAFRSREKQRTFQRMSAGEKITVSGSRLFLAHRTVRRVVMLYAVSLHLLVFFTMMHFTSTQHGAAACPPPYGMGGLESVYAGGAGGSGGGGSVDARPMLGAGLGTQAP